MSNCTCIDEGEPDFNGHSRGCPVRPDKYKKEDPERAQAVMDHIHNIMQRAEYFLTTERGARQILADLEPWLMDVFRAIRGET